MEARGELQGVDQSQLRHQNMRKYRMLFPNATWTQQSLARVKWSPDERWYGVGKLSLS